MNDIVPSGQSIVIWSVLSDVWYLGRIGLGRLELCGGAFGSGRCAALGLYSLGGLPELAVGGDEREASGQSPILARPDNGKVPLRGF